MPLSACEPPAARSLRMDPADMATSNDLHPGRDPTRVLLVEEEPSIAITLCGELSDLGFDVTLERDGAAARTRLGCQDFERENIDFLVAEIEGQRCQVVILNLQL